MKKIHILCSLPFEAAPVASALGLKAVQDDTFRRYESRDLKISLLVTGTGRVRSAAGVVYEFGRSGSRGDIFINIGIAGASFGYAKGDVFLINKITDLSDGRSYYPDMPRGDLNEAGIICADRALSSDDISKSVKDLDISGDVLVDMESAGFYVAASLFTGPHNIMLIKAVSDNGDHETVSKTDIEGYLGGAVELLKQILDKMPADEDDLFDTDFYNGLCEDLRCTEYMRGSLRQIYVYAISEGIDIEKIVNDMTGEGILPVQNKKAATAALAELKKRVVAP